MSPREFDLYCLRRDLADGGPNQAAESTPVIVFWPLTTGGTLDLPTGAIDGGTVTTLSGVLQCYVQQEPSRSVQRQHAEIEVGDLILDCAPEGLVTVYPGQVFSSGVMALDDMDTPIFLFNGKRYSQKETGDQLTRVWDQTDGGTKMERTLLLSLAK